MKSQMLSIKIFTALLALVVAAGCSKARLEQSNVQSFKAADTSAEFCTPDSSNIKGNLKFIFIVDRSGSNRLPDPVVTDMGVNDEDGSRRFAPLIEFVDQNEADENIFWTMINLGTGGRILTANNEEMTTDQNAFKNLLQDQYTRTRQIDTQWTDYLAALDELRKLLERDIESTKKSDELISSTYVVFFVSDGFPVVQSGTTSVPQDVRNIQEAVSGIMALRENAKEVVDSIQFNTAYYYARLSADPNGRNQQLAAQSLLQTMATIGNGAFLSFGGGDKIDFSRFAVPEKILRFQNREVWIENMNTVWEDGVLLRDTDADGLSDVKELMLGSNPELADSDGNGVSDYVEYILKSKPCKDATCSAQGSDPYSSCAGLSNTTTYGDKDNDGLNDCEELLLGSNPLSADSNDDFVPDLLALRKGVALLQGQNDLLADPDKDGVSNYEELLLGTPSLFNNDKIKGLKVHSYTKNIVTQDPLKSCYTVGINEIASLLPNDKIRVYLVDTTDVIAQKRVYRKAERSMQDRSVTFIPSDFE
ncbi:MAG: hypothetical protein COT74_13760 [Bdellovibrionales bacterium CG10_big_fil_rev_8_21_14_0_10_45_34]|nr:MAG: hypothetical protein COT74_13760 [Bdellovibrionales bacterium CG10_big_fil_rev_8_21_14_0_10_45_34]